LEGVELEEGRGRQGKEDRDREKEEESIQEEEIREVVRKMKRRKAAGVDGILMEAWKFAGRNLWNILVRLLRQIWEEGEIPEDWRKEIVVPIDKKGDPSLPSNRGDLSLSCAWHTRYIRN